MPDHIILTGIAAPAAQHYALATQALDAGKHCEENILWSFAPHDIPSFSAWQAKNP